MNNDDYFMVNDYPYGSYRLSAVVFYRCRIHRGNFAKLFRRLRTTDTDITAQALHKNSCCKLLAWSWVENKFMTLITAGC